MEFFILSLGLLLTDLAQVLFSDDMDVKSGFIGVLIDMFKGSK